MQVASWQTSASREFSAAPIEGCARNIDSVEPAPHLDGGMPLY
jgi:hypothetical protein